MYCPPGQYSPAMNIAQLDNDLQFGQLDNSLLLQCQSNPKQSRWNPSVLYQEYSLGCNRCAPTACAIQNVLLSQWSRVFRFKKRHLYGILLVILAGNNPGP